MREPTGETFLNDVANHHAEVLLNNGVYRHLRFKEKSGSWNMHFSIVSWPGYLTICGDMGTWTFSRVVDMFDFFRDDKLRINPDYWGEKVKNGTHGGRDNTKSFSAEAFGERLLEQLQNYYSFEGDELGDISEAVKDEVLRDDWYCDLIIAARDFTYTFKSGKRFRFDTCELPDGKEYDYHFIWCLYAIVWGIQQFDKVTSSIPSVEREVVG